MKKTNEEKNPGGRKMGKEWKRSPLIIRVVLVVAVVGMTVGSLVWGFGYGECKFAFEEKSSSLECKPDSGTTGGTGWSCIADTASSSPNCATVISLEKGNCDGFCGECTEWVGNIRWQTISFTQNCGALEVVQILYKPTMVCLQESCDTPVPTPQPTLATGPTCANY